jgi:hypothetical protein
MTDAMQVKETPLPCPFCGKQPQSYWQSAGESDDCGYWAIECCSIFVHEDDEADERDALRANEREAQEVALTKAKAIRALIGQPSGNASEARTCATCNAVLADGPQPAATYEAYALSHAPVTSTEGTKP